MIPKFPEFKILELSDKEDVEKFTSKYPPYSDFNFAGTWSWDVRDQMKISQLNDNYVVRFINYLTGEPFYTFLGENEVNDTAKKLLDLSIKENLKPELRLIGEESVKLIDTSTFKITEDRDNFDYVYSLEELKNYKGRKFQTKRYETKKFLDRYPNTEIKIINLADEKEQENIIALYQKWVTDKKKKEKDFDSQHELIVLKKLLAAHEGFNLISIGIFIGNKLVGFCINELRESEYVVSHVAKIDYSFSDVNSFLMQKNAEFLCSYDNKYLNYEQDLGLGTLRYSKESFRPIRFFKKFTCSYRL